MRAHLVEPLGDAGLHGVLEVDDAEHVRALGDDERRAAALRDALDDAGEVGGHVTAVLLDPAHDRVGRALADRPVVPLDAAHAGLRGERHELGVVDVLRRRAP